jgi:hypothetical protein
MKTINTTSIQSNILTKIEKKILFMIFFYNIKVDCFLNNKIKFQGKISCETCRDKGEGDHMRE